MTGRSLAFRIASATTALVAALVLAGIGAVWLHAQRLQGPELERALAAARDRVHDALEEEVRRLDLVDRLLASDVPFRAYLAEADRESILDNLQERLALYGCDGLLVADGEGTVLADTLHPRDAGRAGAGAALAARALDGAASRGLWSDDRGVPFLVAAAPIVRGGGAASGAVAAFRKIDDALAHDLAAGTGGEILLYARGESGGPAMPIASSSSLTRTALGLVLADPALGIERTLSTGASPRATRIAIDAEPFAALAVPLEDLGGKVVGGFVLLRSVERELASLRGVQRTLTWVGILAVAAALGTSAFLAHRITRPIEALVAAVERVKAGDYDDPPPAGAGGEIGRLAEAFRSMTAQLKEKQEMDAYLASLARGISKAPEARHDGATVTGGGETVAGRFEILAPIGAGGMGLVYKAYDRELREVVALKTLRGGADPKRLERFRAEIRLARRVTHRNVVRTHDLIEADGSYYLTMEYVEGTPLHDLLARGRLPIGAGLRLARQLLAGLEAAHARGVVHADLKPGNLILDGTGTLKIADFGLARLGDEAGGGGIAGTPSYMSPEQARGLAADFRSDVYAAGVILFEIFTGRVPFADGSVSAILEAHRTARPPRPRDVEPGLDPVLESVVLRALEKDPEARFASAAAMALALDAV